MGTALHWENIFEIRRMDLGFRPAEAELKDDLNALEKYPDAGTPLGPIRFVRGHNGWWAECPTTGRGFWYRSLREAVRRWRVVITDYDHGEWVAKPQPGQTAQSPRWAHYGGGR